MATFRIFSAITDSSRVWAEGIRIVSLYFFFLGAKISIAKVNAETSPNITNKYGVRGFPTMLIFKDGQVLASRRLRQ